MRTPAEAGVRVHHREIPMRASSVRSDATFDPSTYLRSIADMFGVLDARQQRDLADRVALLPRHIHQLATDGLIAVPSLKSR